MQHASEVAEQTTAWEIRKSLQQLSSAIYVLFFRKTLKQNLIVFGKHGRHVFSKT